MLRPSLFFNKDAAFSPKTLLNKGSGAAIFLQNLKNLSVQLFCRIPVNDLSWIRSSWTGDMHKIYKKKHSCRSVISIKLQSNFSLGVLLQICCIFSEHLFVRTLLDGCFCWIHVTEIIPLKIFYEKLWKHVTTIV